MVTAAPLARSLCVARIYIQLAIYDRAQPQRGVALCLLRVYTDRWPAHASRSTPPRPAAPASRHALLLLRDMFLASSSSCAVVRPHGTKALAYSASAAATKRLGLYVFCDEQASEER